MFCTIHCNKTYHNHARSVARRHARKALPCKQCGVCSKAFKVKLGFEVVCGKECRMEAARRRASAWKAAMRPDRLCVHCFKELGGTRAMSVCSLAECQAIARSLRNKKWYVKCKAEGREVYADRIKKDPVKWREHLDRGNARFSARLKTDINFKIKYRLRDRLRMALKSQSQKKVKKVEDLLGCSIDDFKKYIATWFSKGMTWENHGEWHLDHITPVASFDLSRQSQQHECFNFSNYQPLWAKDNLSKGSKLQ